MRGFQLSHIITDCRGLFFENVVTHYVNSSELSTLLDQLLTGKAALMCHGADCHRICAYFTLNEVQELKCQHSQEVLMVAFLPHPPQCSDCYRAPRVDC